MINIRKSGQGDDWIDRSSLVGRIALRNILKIPALQSAGRIKNVASKFVICEKLDGDEVRLSFKHLEGVCDTYEEVETFRQHWMKWSQAQRDLEAAARADLESFDGTSPTDDPSAGMKV